MPVGVGKMRVRGLFSALAGSGRTVSGAINVRAVHTRAAPVLVPDNVDVSVLDFPPQPRPQRPLSAIMRKAKTMVFNGPNGEIALPLHHFVLVKWDKDEQSKQRTVTFDIEDECVKVQRGIWGLTRANTANAIQGVTKGHELKLTLVGVGYRGSVEPDPLPRQHVFFSELERSAGHWYAPDQKKAQIERIQRLIARTGENKRLHLRLGFSHPVLIPIPYGVTAEMPQPTVIYIRSADKELLGQFAQEIRRWRVPEPYKGKGIFINDQKIKMKAGKRK